MKTVAVIKRWSLVAILLVLCGSLVLAGCSRGAKTPPVPGEEWADDLRSRIGKHIDDPEKKDRLLNLVDQDVGIFKKLAQETTTYNKKLIDVDRNYHSTPDDFRTVFSKYNQTRYRLRGQSLEVRFRMQALCTLEEWNEISEFRTKKGLFNQLTQSFGIN